MNARRLRGFALSTTFIVVFFVLLAAMTMASLASFNYQLAKSQLLRSEAFNGANTGLSLAIYQLMFNIHWGENAGDVLASNALPPAPGVTVTPDPVTYTLSFNPTNSQGLPFSVNNINQNSQVAGPIDPATGVARKVPPHSALLFVQGQAGSGGQAARRTLEVMLQFPPYLYAIAASNSIQSLTSNVVVSLSGANAVRVDGTSGLSYSFDIPGSIFAGGAINGVAINLAPYSSITGTARYNAGGTTNLAATSGSSGPIPPGTPTCLNLQAASTNDQVPSISLNSFDNSSTATHLALPLPTPGGIPTVSGANYYSGSLTLGDGGVPNPNPPPDGSAPYLTAPIPVCLSDVNLYVDGDLNIPGGIVGPAGGSASGSIFVNGKVNISVGFKNPAAFSTLGSARGIAIFSQGDLSLSPVAYQQTNTNGGTGAQFVPIICGTLYSHGNIVINNGIHFYGSVVACADTGSNVFTSNANAGNVFLGTGAEVTYFPEYSQFGSLSVTSGSGGSLLALPANATDPLLRVVYWREVQP